MRAARAPTIVGVFGVMNDEAGSGPGDYYREQLGLEIEVLPAVQADSLSYDPERRQLIGEELVRVLGDRYAHLTTDGRAVVMGITSWDLYLRAER